MNATDFEMMYIAMDEMEETPLKESLDVGLGYACEKMGIPFNVQHHKDILDFYGRHRAKLAAAFAEGKPRFIAVCEACAKRDAAEGKA